MGDGGSRNTIASLSLGLVQRGVGDVEDVVRRQIVAGIEFNETGAERYALSNAFMFDVEGFYPGAYGVADSRLSVRIGLRIVL